MATSGPLQGIRNITALPIENKRVFIRCDFNVPLDGPRITDDSRIREALPTIKHALERGARVVLASHLGRPKKGPEKKYSLEPCALRLAELLEQDVTLPEDCVGDAAKKVVFDLRGGQVALLENLRFHPEEEKDDEAFCRDLSELADVYVDEPLVSSDFIGDPHSSCFDATQTMVLGERFAKVFSWYDNEWGFSNRMVELTKLVASKL